MSCTHCGEELLVFHLPPAYRSPSLLPAGFDDPTSVTAASICPQCLAVEPVTDSEASLPALEGSRTDRISQVFPSSSSAAVPMALGLACCASFAHNRSTLARLLERVEQAGTDPLLTIDRLLDDPGIEPSVALERRRHQIEQLLYG